MSPEVNGKQPVGKRVRTEVEATSSVPSNSWPHSFFLGAIRPNSWFVKGWISGVEVDFLLDTGAECSIVNEGIWREIEKGDRKVALESVSSSLVLANGERMSVSGVFTSGLVLGGLNVEGSLMVAPIGDLNGVLGLDFLEKLGAVLDLAQGVLQIDDYTITMHKTQNSKSLYCRICVEEMVTIPANSEMSVVGKVPLDWEQSCSVGILEPVESLPSSHGLLLARAVVCPSRGSVPLRLLNLNEDSVTIKAGCAVATLSPTAGVSSLDQQEETCHDELPEYLQPLVEGCRENLSASESEKLVEFLRQYVDLFSRPDGQVGVTNLIQHQIDTGDNRPIKQRAWRLPFARRRVAEEEIQRMLKLGVIEPSCSPWTSPVVLVTKSDGSIRFCVDYRKLNSCTRKDAYPLPQITECLDTLSGSCWFSTLDLTTGYWQVPMAPEDKDKTAFSIGSGLYQFNVLPFGLCNAPATFERLMEKVLFGLQWKQCLIYLDDIIIFSKSFDAHLSDIQAVFDRLKTAGLTLKPKKCFLFRKSVKYLGHIVSEEGISCDPEKVAAVERCTVPTSKTEARVFVGMVSYYRRFIPDFASVAAPLFANTTKDGEFLWSLDCQKAFVELKALLTSAPVLSYPQQDAGSFILDTDASGYGISGVLSQIQGGEERVLAYGSRTLSKIERRYCTTKRELLAVRFFVEYFKPYLYGRRFILRCDHASLQWLKNFKQIDGILARWLSVLETYDFELTHRKGREHQNADALSRSPLIRCPRDDCFDCKGALIGEDMDDYLLAPLFAEEESPQVPEGVDGWIANWTDDQLRQMQKSDSVVSQILTWKLQSSVKPHFEQTAGCSAAVKCYLSLWHELEVRDGILYKVWRLPYSETRTFQLVAPKEVREFIFNELHRGRVGGHFGVTRTVKKIRARFYWPGYRRDVERWCKKCNICAKVKPGGPRKGASLQHVVVGAPLERIAIDICGPFNETRHGNQYILVLCDYFTKWTEAYAIPNHTAHVVADKMVTEFVSRFGVPQQIHSDQGAEFESNLFQGLCDLLRITKTRTCPYRPQSDGLVERANRTLKQMLQCVVNDARDDWDDHLPYVMMAYRASIQESTNCSPNLLMLGRETNLPVDLMFQRRRDPVNPVCPVEYVEWVKAASQEAFEFVQENLKTSALRQKRLYDQNKCTPEFREGDWVLRKLPPREKLGMTWHGPYLVLGKTSEVTYKVQLSENSRVLIVHVDHLKLYTGDPEPVNWTVPLGDGHSPHQAQPDNDEGSGQTQDSMHQTFTESLGNGHSEISDLYSTQSDNNGGLNQTQYTTHQTPASTKRRPKPLRSDDFHYYSIAEVRGTFYPCSSQVCSAILTSQEQLERHYRERHVRVITMYMCPVKGCNVKRKSQHNLFQHLLKGAHADFPVLQPPELRELLRCVPMVCELRDNLDYIAPDLRGGEPPVNGPGELPVHRVPMKDKAMIEGAMRDALEHIRRPVVSEVVSESPPTPTCELQQDSESPDNVYVEREDRVCRVLLGELGWTDGSNMEELRGEVDAIGELIIRLTRRKKEAEGMIIDRLQGRVLRLQEELHLVKGGK